MLIFSSKQNLSMKQENNFKAYYPQPSLNIKQNHLKTLSLRSQINPEVEKNKFNDQTIYCNPAVHLKKNFLKFTKAASNPSYQKNSTQLKKQQPVIKQQYKTILNNSTNDQMKILKEENRILQQNIQFLEIQSKYREVSLIQKNGQLIESELAKKIRQMQKQLYSLRENESKLNSLIDYYKSASLRCEKCKQAESNYKSLQQKYVEMSERSKQFQKILQSQNFIFQNTIKSKNDQYKSALAYKNNDIKSLEMRISILQNENKKLNNQLSRSTAIQENHSISKLERMGAQFQVRIGEVSNENIKLKNIMNRLQGKVEQLNSKNLSLQNTIRAYESCEQLYNGSKTKSELDLLRAKIELAKEQYDKMASKYQFEILKLQNMIAQKKLEEQSLLGFSDKERLRQALMSAIWEIQTLKGRCKEMK